MKSKTNILCIFLLTFNALCGFSQGVSKFHDSAIKVTTYDTHGYYEGYKGVLESYDFERAAIKVIPCDMHGCYEENAIIDKNYDLCRFFDIPLDDTGKITRILFYPEYAYIKGGDRRSKIVINVQEFVFKGSFPMAGTERFFTVSHAGKKYLVMTGSDSAARDVSPSYIFDITNMNRIRFYLLEDRFNRFTYDPVVDEYHTVVGIFRGELCFFASQSQHTENLKYFMCPFFIKDNTLQEMTGESGKKYRVYFTISYPGYKTLTILEKTF